MKQKRYPIRLAYAEDHLVVRQGLVNLLSLFDEFQFTLEAEDGEDLIQKLKRADVIPDVCILDMNMPIKNGLETLKEVRPQWPDLKVLMLTQYDDEDLVIRVMRHGASGFITKSCNVESLRYAINTVYERNYYHSEILSDTSPNAIYDEQLCPNLSEREILFLKYCCEDKTYKEIAEILHLSSRTVEGYRDHLFEKLKIKTRIGLVMYAIRTGIVSPF
jgi:DNA-binding NarL/FixJ family response regulator